MATAEGLPATDEHADLWLRQSELASWLSVVRLITRIDSRCVEIRSPTAPATSAGEAQLERSSHIVMFSHS
jgi:hypothetical protein